MASDDDEGNATRELREQGTHRRPRPVTGVFRLLSVESNTWSASVPELKRVIVTLGFRELLAAMHACVRVCVRPSPNPSNVCPPIHPKSNYRRTPFTHKWADGHSDDSDQLASDMTEREGVGKGMSNHGDVPPFLTRPSGPDTSNEQVVINHLSRLRPIRVVPAGLVTQAGLAFGCYCCGPPVWECRLALGPWKADAGIPATGSTEL